MPENIASELLTSADGFCVEGDDLCWSNYKIRDLLLQLFLFSNPFNFFFKACRIVAATCWIFVAVNTKYRMLCGTDAD